VSARGAEPSALQDWGLNRRAACGPTPGRSARWSFEGKGRALGVRARRSEAFRVHLRACVCSRANAELLRLWHHLGDSQDGGHHGTFTPLVFVFFFARALALLCSFSPSLPRSSPELSFPRSPPASLEPTYIPARTPKCRTLSFFPCPRAHSNSVSSNANPHMSSFMSTCRALQLAQNSCSPPDPMEAA